LQPPSDFRIAQPTGLAGIHARPTRKIWNICRNRLRQREHNIEKIAAIVFSIDHSPLQINPIFIVLFKPFLDPEA
jgi:hypothetical protein